VLLGRSSATSRSSNISSSGIDIDDVSCRRIRFLLWQGRGERYDGTSSRTGPLRPKRLKKIDLKDTAKKTNKNILKYKGGDALQGRLQRRKWTQHASSLAQGGKNSTLKGEKFPQIWVVLMIVL